MHGAMLLFDTFPPFPQVPKTEVMSFLHPKAHSGHGIMGSRALSFKSLDPQAFVPVFSHTSVMLAIQLRRMLWQNHMPNRQTYPA